MKKWLKKYFIPHEGNNHKPHILRWEAGLFTLAIILVIELFFLVQVFIFSPGSEFFATILKSVLVEETNISRGKDSVSLLTENLLLDAAAQAKADDMARKGYFSHVSPDGSEPWYWIKNAGYDYGYAGENLAINFIDSEDVVRAWMDSPKHRENILNNNFKEIGIGVSRGLYDGKEAVFVVQMFGSRVLALNVPIETRKNETILPISPTTTLPEETAVVAVKGAEISPKIENKGSDQNQVSRTESGLSAAAKNILERVISSPRTLANYLYLIIGTIIVLALTLKIFVKIKVQRPKLIINGILLLMIIASAMAFNYYLFLAQAAIF
ncbi:MAG: CAP domain-containing protein [Candidatus Wolfebacteria bacterium]|nr:CAP domain-containing protein [Candidatus Wolfebacteria bacterium]